MTAAYSQGAPTPHDYTPRHKSCWLLLVPSCIRPGSAAQALLLVHAAGRLKTADLHKDEGVEDHRVVVLLALCHVVLVQGLPPAGASEHSSEDWRGCGRQRHRLME